MADDRQITSHGSDDALLRMAALYQSRYIGIEDLREAGKPVTFRIKNVSTEMLESIMLGKRKLTGSEKGVLTFERPAGKKCDLILNKTSFRALKHSWGSDAKNWIGATVKVELGTVNGKEACLVTPSIPQTSKPDKRANADVLAGLPVAEDILEVPAEKVQPLPQERSADPLLKNAHAVIVENAEVSTARSAESGSEEAAETPASTPPRESKGDPANTEPPDSDLFQEVTEPPIPKNADLTAALIELSTGTAGQPIEELIPRLDRAKALLGDDRWTKSLDRADYVDGSKMTPAMARKVLCACVEVSK
jgi:hypothetical protein